MLTLLGVVALMLFLSWVVSIFPHPLIKIIGMGIILMVTFYGAMVSKPSGSDHCDHHH